MTFKGVIQVISHLHKLHDACADQAMQNLYLKLCLLECCGWVEMRQDEMLYRTAILKVAASDVEKFKNTKLRRNYGFTYDKHLRQLLIELYGLMGVGKIEESMERNHPKIFSEVKMALNTTLCEPRNSHAHTSAGLTLGVVQKLIHFSVLNETVKQLEEGFNRMEKEILQL